jgi:hypothetical protein
MCPSGASTIKTNLECWTSIKRIKLEIVHLALNNNHSLIHYNVASVSALSIIYSVFSHVYCNNYLIILRECTVYDIYLEFL